MPPIVVYIVLAALGGSVALDARALTYVEAVNGDLSGTAAAPTTVTLDPGVNTLVGTTGRGDFDLLSFDVPAGATLSALTVNAWSGASNQSFWGIARGPIWPTGFGFGVSAAALLGYGLFSAGNIGTNQLMLVPPGPGALGPGSYTLLIQDTAGSTHGYGFTLMLDVPAPAPVSVPVIGAPLLATLLAALGIRRAARSLRTSRTVRPRGQDGARDAVKDLPGGWAETRTASGMGNLRKTRPSSNGEQGRTSEGRRHDPGWVEARARPRRTQGPAQVVE